MVALRGALVSALALLLPALMFIGVDGPSSAVFSQYIGASALICMALSQVIATRVWFVEAVFGPMDRAYLLHKWLGIGALAGVLLHETFDAEIRSLGPGTNLSDFAEGLGEQSLNGLLILIALTLMTFIPYRIWYWTHRAMGACFLLGAAHFALILKPFSNLDPLGLYVLAFCAMGVLAYAHSLVPRSWRRGRIYEVSHIASSGNATSITLRPKFRPIRYRAGQFAFFTFEEPGLTEAHPYTISSGPREDGTLRISVAALGDHTERLASNACVGMNARVQGPYGRFAPPRGNAAQVWIAGGIGITPFLAWLDELPEDGPAIDLIYSFRGVSKAPHLDELSKKVAAIGRVSLHLFDTETGPRLSAEAVSDITNGGNRRYAFCGPSQLRDAVRQNVSARHFQFEEFEIRTSLLFIGRVIAWLKNTMRRLNKSNAAPTFSLSK